MGGSGWTFGSRLADLEDQLHVIHLDDLGRKEGKVGIDLQFSNYEKVTGELGRMWRRSQPVLLTCSALTFLGGLAQLIASSLALSNCYKVIHLDEVRKSISPLIPSVWTSPGITR